eukprot:CAMPEP_0172309362 /NCGR_PEP_ID=MMETSP1058-20130122/9676_1 /TAXON_ID=83371 /ORGANISM="Detonula confervacea, Strain CCMP 353" /LENGTH=318 /DNA_ID=CAMNT_0013021975 /DNA_START=60 /DNA_END=1016 /DNA_ORIENTATION=+
MNCALSLTLLVASYDSVAAFAPPSRSSAPAATTTSFIPSSLQRIRISNSDLLLSPNNDEDASWDMNRRNALQTLSLAFASSVTTAAVLSSNPQQAEAQSEIFKANPLTNSVLEKIRILNQDEADNMKYGGELESGSAKPTEFDQYVDLLQPILSVEHDLAAVDQLLVNNDSNKPITKEDYIALFEKANVILSNPLFVKINFKKAFNAFADNIYYSDPDRANLYLGGGAIPKTSQSIAYLLRNDVLTSVEDMRAEVQYLLKELAKLSDGETVVVGGEGGLDLEEMISLSKIVNGGMVKYLDLVPPKELEVARAKFAASS